MPLRKQESCLRADQQSRNNKLFKVALAGVLLAAASWGCGKRTTVTSLDKSEAEGNQQEIRYVDYPEFLNWNQFPVGTTVIRESEIAGPKGLTTETMTLKLVEKSDESLTVEMQVTVANPDSLLENPPFEIKHLAKVRTTVTAPDLSLPRPDAKTLGIESVSVLGQEITAEVYEWTDTVEAGPMKVKLWRSEAFPGRTIRRETQVKDSFGKGVTSTQTIKFLEVPEREISPNPT